MKDRIRGYCPQCGHEQLFEKTQVRHGVHLFLTIVTCGLWLVSWVSAYVIRQLRPWQCQHCGHYASLGRGARTGRLHRAASPTHPK